MRFVLLFLAATLAAQSPRQISGIYPHLAHFNSQGECGTGAVVPWAGRLWVVSYSPHMPGGSDDKLHEIDSQLHRESNQLFIGPYTIDANRNVRAIPYERMYGRPTGNARHLTGPADRIYYASMEEGFFEVDVHSLAVRTLYEDANGPFLRKETKDVSGPLLPGYHGKGFYSGQGRVVYSNNGEYGAGTKPPDTVSGCLAEWNGKDWHVVRRNQFCEVTGPGGIDGNPNPATDPIWATGWDHRSVILMLLDRGQWHSYRLPKATHTYDGAHGWNTEWPRIRDIGENGLLMTMHGMFWRFPKTFSAANSAGIAPRSTYLKVIGDFTRWQDRLVFGCDDTAQSEFLNTRRVKGRIAAPGQAQSTLWFVEPAKVDHLGAPIGRGAVWIRDDVKQGEPSEPYLSSGFERRMIRLAHESAQPVTFTLEVDRTGNGTWTKLRDIRVDAPLFQGVTRAGGPVSKGLVWARGEQKGALLYSTDKGLYELDAELNLKPVADDNLQQWMRANLAPPANALTADDASVVYVETILTLGDSITAGSKDFSVYRPLPAKKLEAAGIQVRFVGTQHTAGEPEDMRHDGYGGKPVEYLAGSIERIYRANPADIILLHAGHKHFAEEQPVAGILAATEKIITTVRTINPTVIILVAQVIPAGKLPKYAYIPELNRELPRLAAELDVVLVDQATGFDYNTDTVADKVHPNARGAEKMARRWFEALAPLLK